MAEKAKLKGTQWVISTGGAVDGKDLLNLDVAIGQLPGGAILDKVDLAITEAFDGTTPTVAVAMSDIGDEGGSSEVVLRAAASATAVDRVTTHLDTTNALTGPKSLYLTGAAADSTAGRAFGAVSYIVPGRSNENAD